MGERLEIQFTLIERKISKIITVKSAEYHSLMHLIKDKIYTDEFGHCSGMGRCGTCSVYLRNRKFEESDFKRNELTTLRKNGHTDFSTRLSCQIEVDEYLKNEIVQVNNN